VQVPIALPRTRVQALPKRLGSVRPEVIVGAIVGAIVIYLVAVPLAMLIFSSFRATGNTLPFEATTYTLANYVTVFTSSLTYRLALNTIWYAGGSLILGLGLGITFSWLLERTNIPARNSLLVLIMTTLAVPGLVTSMAWLMIANPNNGLLNLILRQVFKLGPDGPIDIYGVPGMIVVTGFSIVPSTYIMISGLFSRMDPALEDAGAMNGATFLSVVKRITIPLLKPGLLAAAIYYFVVITENFEIPALLGLSQRIFVFSTMIYQTTHPQTGLPDFGLASGYAIVQLLASGGLIYWYAQATRNRQQFSVIQGKGYRPRVIDLRAWKWAAFAGVLLYFTITTLIPFFVLLWTSFQPFFSVPSIAGLAKMSWVNYGNMLRLPGMMQAISNTAIVAGVTVVAAMTLGSVVSWMAVRTPFAWSTIPDRFSFLIVATPSIVMGLALMFIYLWVPLPIYGTIAILIIAFTTRYLPFVVRLLSASLLQIHKELEEVAHMSGASWTRTMRTVVIPLALPSVWRASLWVITHAIREATLAVMLFSTSNMTLGTMLWLAWNNFTNVGQAAALAVCILLLSGIFTYFLARSGVFGSVAEPKGSEERPATVAAAA